MNFTPIFAILAFLAALLATWASLRPKNDEAATERLRRQLTEEMERQRRETMASSELQFNPIRQQLLDLGQDLAQSKSEQQRAQHQALAEYFQGLAKAIQDALAAGRKEQGDQLLNVQKLVHDRLDAIQKSNDSKLEEMRTTVDQRLQKTLEERLGERFKQVADRLDLVQKSFGEIKAMADDVSGLKRALTNVKTRGVLGEAQLGALLEQYLEQGQYEANVKVKPRSNEIVEYAVKLPDGPDEGPLWLPVDAKFPIEDYERLMSAYEAGLPDEIARHARALEDRVLSQARDIRDKYISVPNTTDFAILFLPFEGLYAEVLRRPGLLQRLQRECKVMLAGPTTLTAFLNSLQMGFRTLKVSKNTAEIAKLLGAVKTDFGRFAEALEAVDKKLDEAKSKLGDASNRRRLLQDKLKKVDGLSEPEAQAVLGFEKDLDS
jgi:DNA recombination protein RmuC